MQGQLPPSFQIFIMTVHRKAPKYQSVEFSSLRQARLKTGSSTAENTQVVNLFAFNFV